MRKIIIFLFFTSISSLIFGQQLPQYSLYMLNEVIVNPASLASQKDNKVTLMLRDQWASFKGAPVTQSIYYNHLINKTYKTGISIVNDKTGPISIINATLSGSYNLPIKGENKLSIGAAATVIEYSIDNAQIVLENDGVIDPALFGGVEKVNGSSLSVGAYYFSNDYFISFASPNIIGSYLNIGNNQTNNKLDNHYYFNSGYNFNLKNNNKIVPSILLKKIGALPAQLDINLKGVYDDFLWTGISYRANDAIVALFGFNYNQSSFGYSYDITTSSVRYPSSGTHSLLFSYKFKNRIKDKDRDGILDIDDECPKIPGLLSLNGCPDIDKDGIKDSDDECPNIFGLLINKGCPDSDGDGIVDKKDSCVYLPGLERYNGCPDTDGDGLQDRYDDCPFIFGSLFNKGCPKNYNQDTIYITKTIIKFDTVYVSSKENKYLSQEFKNIQFNHNDYSLTASSKNILERVYKYLEEKLKLRILIVGHTDDVDNDDFNLILSEKRVKTVKLYLVNKGISDSRIEINWKGEFQPLFNDTSAESRAKNRRVEVNVIDK